MRTWLVVLVLTWCLAAQAHIGSPNIFMEGDAGPNPVRVVIRPPDVVPGLAEITVRVQAPVARVSVLPVYSRTGRAGSPAPDLAELVRGQTNVYSAQLWLMRPGAYSVDVTVDGPRGAGILVVPVNSMATNTRPMARSYAAMLLALAAILVLAGLRIAGAMFGESLLPPGTIPARKDRWRGRAAMAGAAAVLGLMLFGGNKWWAFEDRVYHSKLLYRPPPIYAQVRSERDQWILSLRVDPALHRGRWTPLLPDHGKLMHLFLVRDGEPGAFAHLHPLARGHTHFEAALPPLPAGEYHVYTDVTHEDGFAETLTAQVNIPAASATIQALWLANSPEPVCSSAVAERLATNLVLAPDPDDSWHLESARKSASRPAVAPVNAPVVIEASGGYRFVWENPNPSLNDPEASLRFHLITPGGQSAPIEPYMGMLGHAIIRREDGGVFAHAHPVGNFSMAAQQFFENGQPPAAGGRVKPSQLPGPRTEMASSENHSRHSAEGAIGSVAFPFSFPSGGAYRVWVQMKSQGRILTGAFDAIVGAPN